MQTWAIVVAAGGGARFGAAKQFARLGDVSVLDRAVGVARESCDGVVVVLPAGRDWAAPAGVRVAIGGATRSASVRAGLACVPADVDVVVVHDAARPLASRARCSPRVIAAVRDGADGAVPGVPVADTVKRVRDDVVVETVPRDDLVAVQTPQAFRRGRVGGRARERRRRHRRRRARRGRGRHRGGRRGRAAQPQAHASSTISSWRRP